jgi:L-asparaginase II
MTSAYRGGEPVAETVRSDFPESFHRGSVAVVGPDGESPIFPRSANKPMQAVAMLRSGWKPESEADLAIAAASHKGEPMHVDRVGSILTGAEMSEDQLQCPPDLPGDPAALRRALSSGSRARRTYMNCSGKHAGMLAACAAAGWDPATYRDPRHPLQRRIRAVIEELSGETVEAIGVDGCGAPVMALSLTGLARAFTRMVESDPETHERAVADAMRAHPELIAGTGTPDSRAMAAVPGLLATGGAEGVHAVAVPGVGAVAVKIDDGAGRASMPVALRALASKLEYRFPESAAGVIEELAAPAVLGGGQPVGRLRVLL